MATSETQICANALRLIGAAPITDLLENNSRARLCNAFYPDSRDEVLRMARWKCAEKEIALAEDNPKVTVFGFTHSYQLPTDYIRVWATSLDREWGGSGAAWQIQGNKLVSDESPVSISYVFRLTNVLTFDTLLAKAIEYDLAAKLAYPVTTKMDLQKMMEGMRDRACRQAAAITGQEQTKKRYQSTMLTKDVR